MQDRTFLTRQRGKQKSSFESKYLERFAGSSEHTLGMPTVSPQLIAKQQEMEKTNAQLEEARHKFETWKVGFLKKRKEVDEKQQQLADQKRHLDAFTSQQKLSLEKARKKEAEELEQSRLIEQQLEELKEEENQLRVESDELRKELESLQPCADYLQSVVDAYSCFESVEAILNRHQSLAETRAEYVERYESLMERYVGDEATLAHQLDIRKSRLIDSTMKYNEGMARIAQAIKRNQYRRTTLIKDVQRIEDKTVELVAMKTAIRTIYARALVKTSASGEQRRGGKISEEAMLEYIENRFNDLKDILEDKKVVYIQDQPEPPHEQPAQELTRMSTLLHMTSSRADMSMMRLPV
jgi:chromosome segregation ATPase